MLTLKFPPEQVVTDSPRSHEPGAEKRRSTRLAKAVPIKINGTDALGQPFQESTLTVMIDCYGCKYQSTHYAPKDSTVSVEIRRLEPPRPSRVVQARVVWVQRPKTYREVYHVALAFEVPGNVWGIPWPPSDWFPCPGEEETPVAEELTAPDPVATALAPAAVAGTSRGLAAQLAVADEVVLDCTVEMMSELEKSRIRARGASEAEAQLAAVRQVVRLATAEALAEQSTVMRQELDAAMRYVVEQNAERVGALLEATRKELEALREALNAQPARRAKSPSASGKRRTKQPAPVPE